MLTLDDIRSILNELMEEYKVSINAIVDMAKAHLNEASTKSPKMDDLKKDAAAYSSSVLLAAKATVVTFPHYIPLQGVTKETSM